MTYSIHDCNPSINRHSIPNQSELMTWDNQFIDDKQPKLDGAEQPSKK